MDRSGTRMTATSGTTGYGPAVATDFINRFREDGPDEQVADALPHLDQLVTLFNRHENATVDEEYAAYYDALFDEMHRQGIEPIICLGHYERCQACCADTTNGG